MIQDIRNAKPSIVVVGNHTKILQSILDFDYASGRETPSVVGIISSGRKSQKLFWGDGEVLIPVFESLDITKKLDLEPHFLLCVTSASSAPKLISRFFELFPSALGAHIFAEGVAERDALFLVEQFSTSKLVAGPSGVGLCIPGSLKLGAIGGISGVRLAELGSTAGSTAVICSSGGMVNEIMYQVVAAGSGISFAACYGGDRFPVTSPLQWLLEAQNDPQTKHIVYFGELGGNDEYILRDAIRAKQITKPIYAYIAGRFETKNENIQFGHAKALAKAESETAKAKTAALQAVGVNAADSFGDFMALFNKLEKKIISHPTARTWKERPFHVKPTLFTAPRYKSAKAANFTEAVLLRILNVPSVSRETVDFVEKVFIKLIDHGPHVSGAANTMITTRAGRDMSSAIATGLLTIGDRFGGAVNGAAETWFNAVSHGTTPENLVAHNSASRAHILGIGHLKYSIYKPDPRVSELVTYAKGVLRETTYLSFAQAVAALTTKKRANLILNVDGAISAIFMDFLSEKEGFSSAEIKELLEIGFFNSLFVIPRTVGFTGNYLDQKRIDEGLFRLDDGSILSTD